MKSGKICDIVRTLFKFKIIINQKRMRDIRKDISSINKPEYIMNSLIKIWWGGVSLAEIGILVFWIACFNGNLEVAKYAFFAAGCFACVAVIAGAIHKLKERNAWC